MISPQPRWWCWWWWARSPPAASPDWGSMGTRDLCDGLLREKESVKFIKTRNHLCFWANNLWSLGWLYVLAKPVQTLLSLSSIPKVPNILWRLSSRDHQRASKPPSLSRLSMLPSTRHHQDIRLCSWPRSPYIGNADDMRDLHFFTFNQEPCYISTLHLRHSTTQPSLCEYISATARHCVMEVSECVRIKPPFHPSSTSTMHSTQHWSQAQKLGSLLAFAKTFTQKGGLKVHAYIAYSSCEFI